MSDSQESAKVVICWRPPEVAGVAFLTGSSTNKIKIYFRNAYPPTLNEEEDIPDGEFFPFFETAKEATRFMVCNPCRRCQVPVTELTGLGIPKDELERDVSYWN